MYPYTHQPQNPLAGLDLYDPGIRQYIAQHYPQYVHMLPPVQFQPQYQPQYQQPQYVAPPQPVAPDFGLTLAEQ
jgi:hypothetical protein